MARKKRMKKARKSVRKVKKSKRAGRNVRSKKMLKTMTIKRKLQIVVNNLLLFMALSLVSFVLYRFIPKLIQNDFLKELFSIMAMIFGFVASGFLIVLLILLIMKMVSSKK